jgi:hypothetical protein
MEARRWDGDQRGRGIASGAPFAPGVTALRERLDQADWVTEDAHAHLLPHIARACAAAGDVEIRETRLTEDGILEVALDWHPFDDSPPLRNRIFGIIGSFAESSTHVLQRTEAETRTYDVVTGMLPDQTPFRTHGHLVRFRVTSASAPDA